MLIVVIIECEKEKILYKVIIQNIKSYYIPCTLNILTVTKNLSTMAKKLCPQVFSKKKFHLILMERSAVKYLLVKYLYISKIVVSCTLTMQLQMSV